MFYHLETARQWAAWNPYTYKTRALRFVRQLANLDPSCAHDNHCLISSGMHPYNYPDQVLWKKMQEKRFISYINVFRLPFYKNYHNFCCTIFIYYSKVFKRMRVSSHKLDKPLYLMLSQHINAFYWGENIVKTLILLVRSPKCPLWQFVTANSRQQEWWES